MVLHDDTGEKIWPSPQLSQSAWCKESAQFLATQAVLGCIGGFLCAAMAERMIGWSNVYLSNRVTLCIEVEG